MKMARPLTLLPKSEMDHPNCSKKLGLGSRNVWTTFPAESKSKAFPVLSMTSPLEVNVTAFGAPTPTLPSAAIATESPKFWSTVGFGSAYVCRSPPCTSYT